MFKDELEMGINVKLLLYLFKNMTELKVKFGSSELVPTIVEGQKLEMYGLFIYQIRNFSVRYLGALG
jgi:hypothetical protein